MTSRRAARYLGLAALCAGMLVQGQGSIGAEGGGAPAGTPAEMVATYESLADSILAVKKTESNLVRAILATTYAHARIQLEHARAALKGGGNAGAAFEGLAGAVGQLATEGDSAVGGVRKRLLEGGHHHNAAGEAKGIYDEGYVIVTRAAKQAFLDSSKAIGALAHAPKADALEAEWKKVETTWATIMK